ncbi:MAG TPA: hypothetical protein VEJ84_03320 [Acidimicrobiales bacterium]|nr:hypothetical protein [Acidimicrobiales bacterium]
MTEVPEGTRRILALVTENLREFQDEVNRRAESVQYEVNPVISLVLSHYKDLIETSNDVAASLHWADHIAELQRAIIEKKFRAPDRWLSLNSELAAALVEVARVEEMRERERLEAARAVQEAEAFKEEVREALEFAEEVQEAVLEVAERAEQVPDFLEVREEVREFAIVEAAPVPEHRCPCWKELGDLRDAVLELKSEKARQGDDSFFALSEIRHIFRIACSQYFGAGFEQELEQELEQVRTRRTETLSERAKAQSSNRPEHAAVQNQQTAVVQGQPAAEDEVERLFRQHAPSRLPGSTGPELVQQTEAV